MVGELIKNKQEYAANGNRISNWFAAYPTLDISGTAMVFIPAFIKPTRSHAKLPSLDFSRTAKNSTKGVETTVVLDLNILSKMKDVVFNSNAYESSGLRSVISKFNKLPLVLTPGFALAEADEAYTDILWGSWEVFLSIYCPAYADTPNATRDKNNHGRGRKFITLPVGDQRMQSIAYLAILAISVIAKRDEHLPPEKKFEAYVDFMCSRADMLSAVEAEVARYCFFDKSTETDIAFRNSSETIRKNFMKGGGTPEVRLEKALNSARDINYYRVVATLSNKELDGKIQDTWLLTADDGLKRLAESIYFVPDFDGSYSKTVKLVRNQSQKTSKYWKFCDMLFADSIAKRNSLGDSVHESGWSESHVQQIFDCIREQEDIVRALYV